MRLTTALSAITIVLLLFAACLTDPNHNPDTTPIILRGSVFETDSVTVIPGVNVRIVGGDGQCVTDDSGYYIFDNIAYYRLGSFITVSASKDGYETLNTDVSLWEKRVTQNIYMSMNDSTN